MGACFGIKTFKYSWNQNVWESHGEWILSNGGSSRVARALCPFCTLSLPSTPPTPLPTSSTTTASSTLSTTTAIYVKSTTLPHQIPSPILLDHSDETRKIKILKKVEFEKTSPATPTLSHTHSPFYNSIEHIEQVCTYNLLKGEKFVQLILKNKKIFFRPICRF